MRKFFRKSIVAKQDIEKNEKISLVKVEGRRPGKYIGIENLGKILNKKIKKKIKKDEPFKKIHV